MSTAKFSTTSHSVYTLRISIFSIKGMRSWILIDSLIAVLSLVVWRPLMQTYPMQAQVIFVDKIWSYVHISQASCAVQRWIVYSVSALHLKHRLEKNSIFVGATSIFLQSPIRLSSHVRRSKFHSCHALCNCCFNLFSIHKGTMVSSADKL